VSERETLRSASSSRQGGADRQIAHLSALLADSEAQNSRLEKLAEVRWAHLSALLADSEAQNSRLEKLAEVRWPTCQPYWQTVRHKTPGWRNWQR
jgi:hypothetical protein